MLAIAFGFLLLELLVLSKAHQLDMFKGIKLLGLSIFAATLYWIIFERKKK